MPHDSMMKCCRKGMEADTVKMPVQKKWAGKNLMIGQIPEIKLSSYNIQNKTTCKVQQSLSPFTYENCNQMIFFRGILNHGNRFRKTPHPKPVGDKKSNAYQNE
jgi:hypothetical protein